MGTANTSVDISWEGLNVERGDPLHQICTMNGPAIVTGCDGITITYRAWRWYDGPRLWLRSVWRSIVERF